MAKVYGVILLMLLAGCKCEPTAIDTSAFLSSLDSAQAANEIYSESILAKQDESLTALAAIKSQVESLNGSVLETRQAVGTMEASMKAPALNMLGGDPASALEPQETEGKESQPAILAASPPAVRLSGPLKLSWNVEGNWNPSILETAKHLREDHGIIADGMSHQQMHDAHAAAHEGRKPVAMKSQAVQMINRGTQCPGGVCPTPRRGLFGRRR
jgi:hypothetical protein